MNDTSESPTPPTPPSEQAAGSDDASSSSAAEVSDRAPRPPGSGLRAPSFRLAALLAAAMLGVGVAVGAAIGPAPTASYAGAASSVAQRLPLLLAAIAGHNDSVAATQTAPAATPTTPEPPAPTPSTATPAPASTGTAPSTTTTPAESSPPQTAPTPKSSTETSKPKLPPVTNVWLIELAGTSFAEAVAAPSAAPYITGQLIPASTLLSGWSAVTASAFASEAVLAEPPAAGAAPPLLHTIVQPPCPEGAAGSACAPGTPGQLTAADEFLHSALAQITATPVYREHGLVVVTFATVGIAAQAGLPAGAASTTLTYQPPAGAALISPFVHAGARSAVAFNPTSPRQSLQKLLH